MKKHQNDIKYKMTKTKRKKTNKMTINQNNKKTKCQKNKIPK